MLDPIRGADDQQLDALFQAYRRAYPAPDPSANFMPELWRRIEARQKFTFSFRRMAHAFATAAVALSLALGAYMALPHRTTPVPDSYIEVLAESKPLDIPDFVTPVRLDISEHGR